MNNPQRARSMQKQQQPISRRILLKRFSAIAIFNLALPNLLAACTRSDPNDAEPVADCQEDVGSSDGAARKAVNYVTPSPHPEKTCANCHFFKVTQNESTCGTCEIVAGPIAPEAYCDAWVLLKESS